MGAITFQYDILVNRQTVPELTTDYTIPIGSTAEKSRDPKGNETTKVTDAAGRLIYVISEGKVTAYSYDENGNRSKVVYPDGKTKEEYEYYKDNLLKKLTNTKADGTTMDEYSYIYDGAHNQTSKTEIINGKEKGTTSYTYDRLNRLIEIREPVKAGEISGRNTSYTYDAAGNRETERTTTSKAAATKTTLITYKYNEQNRLMSVTEETGDGTKKTTTYTYDGNGNMTRKSMEQTRQIDPSNAPKAKFGIYIEGQLDGATKNAKPIVSGIASYEYNVWNQLKKATTAEGTSTYKYNGEGYRTEKTENGKTTISLYEADKIILETDANGKEIARNLYGTNLITRTVTENTTTQGSSTTQKTSYNYMYNGHGDVTALLTQDGTIAASYYYDAFGTALEIHYYNASGEETSKAVNNPYRYAGYIFDSTTDLYYLNARYYDSKIARFMSEDTYTGEMNDPLSLNLYTYCHNNPIAYTDPTGHAVAKVGTRGDTVQAIQEKLNKLGYNVGKADGVFGEQTKAAVIKFQKDNGLSVDGIVGNQTLTEIYFEQSKQRAKANGITLPEAQKAKVGQLSGNVSIMTDAKFNQALQGINELKSKTNGGSVNTDVKDNEIVVNKVNFGSTEPTSAPVTLTPQTPVPAASSSKMSSLINNVASISSAISASNVATVNASKSTSSVGNGTGKSTVVQKNATDKVGDTVKGFAWGVMDNIPGYRYVVQTIQFNTTGNYFRPDVAKDDNSDFANGYSFGDNLLENITISIVLPNAINSYKVPELSISPSGEATISASGSGGTGTIYFADDLRRPYIRKNVKEEVNNNAPRTPDGKPIDPNTGKPIEGKPDFGHKPGNEFWREKINAESEGLTQKEFNDRMNNPDKYQLENPASNRSHRYEMPK